MSEIKILEPMFCDCTEEWGPRGPKGKPTKMQYKGNGRWECPKCKHVEDHHPVIFKMYLKFTKNEDYLTTEIINPIIDDRLTKLENPTDRYTKKQLIEDAILEMADELEGHEEGVFEVELRYNAYFDEEAGDGDIDFNIVTERKVTDLKELEKDAS